MNAGKLREHVTIETPTRSNDGAGGTDVTWAALANVRAEVTSRSGAEAVLGEKLEARQRYTITMRYRDDVTTDMRAIWRGETLNIRAVRDPDGRRQWLELSAEGGAA